jgi:uncharacterized membrane protein YdfJ with MMPL/SSD domain
VALASGPETTSKTFAAGILLDATVVRAPPGSALVSLGGDWNWWLADGARRLLLLPSLAGRGRPDALPAEAAS